MKQSGKILKNLMWLTQLGLSILAPPLLCVWGGYWLENRFALGSWVMVVAIILGLGASVSSAVSFYRVAGGKLGSKETGEKKSFNRHD